MNILLWALQVLADAPVRSVGVIEPERGPGHSFLVGASPSPIPETWEKALQYRILTEP
jgi:hypothetical protein